MPDRRDNGPFSKTVAAEDGVQHVIFEKSHKRTHCSHNLEFWVAVRTRQNGEPVVVQWCMRCQASEVLTWEEYELRKSRRLITDSEYDSQTDWLDALR